jgi:hypothetical protein
VSSSGRWRHVAALALGVLATLQMAGDVLGSRSVVGIAAAWGFAPRPKVFSDVDGLEPFASTFTLRWEEPSGRRGELPLTPELYARLEGPYNRRNVYGAALSYAPRLPEELWEPVFCHGLRVEGSLRRELDLPVDARYVSVEIRTRTRGRRDTWLLEPVCEVFFEHPHEALFEE